MSKFSEGIDELVDLVGRVYDNDMPERVKAARRKAVDAYLAAVALIVTMEEMLAGSHPENLRRLTKAREKWKISR